jgi:2'-5' RNA ligase
MKIVVVLVSLFLFSLGYAKCEYQIGQGVIGKFVNYDGDKTQINIAENIKPISFLFKQKTGCFGSYISLNISYTEVSNVFKQIQTAQRNLKNRGEAHITLLTPPEFQNLFVKNKISMNRLREKINESFSAANISFTVESIGSGHIGKLSTYFLIVRSNDLEKLRESLAELLPDNDRTEFLKTGFYPHITLGFNKRDLHISEGIRKDFEYSNDNRFELKTMR